MGQLKGLLGEPRSGGRVVGTPQRVEQCLSSGGRRPAWLGVVAVVPGPDASGRVALAVGLPSARLHP